MFRQLGVGIAAFAILCAFTPAAEGSPLVTRADPISLANPHIKPEVIAALPPVLRSSSLVIGPDVTVDTPIIYPDGSPVPGQSAAQSARAAACGGPYTFVKGVATSGCAVAGSAGTRVRYTWNSNVDAPAPVGCVAPEAHDDVGRVRWQSTTCGTSGVATVPWGNNLARPRIKATSGDDLFRGGWSHASVSSSSKCVVEKYATPPSVSKNTGRIKCPNVFTNMRARVIAGGSTRYGNYVGPNAWSKVVFNPGSTVTSVYPSR